MSAIVIILIIVWLFIIQNKLNKLSESVNALKNSFLTDCILPKKQSNPKKNIPEDTNEKIAPESPQKSLEPESINDIPDSYFFNQTNKNKESEDTFEQKSSKEKQPTSFENLFLGNIFNKIGAFAILIGLVILIKLVLPYFVFTDELKIILGYLAGFGMIIGALKLNSKANQKSFSEVLLGTGFGALFISTYYASGMFEFFNLSQTVIIASAILLAAFYLADKLKTISMLVISLLAAYINPIVFNAGFDVSTNFLFGYFIFINILALVYTYRNNSREVINCINLIATFIAVALFHDNDTRIIMPIILWIIYIAYDLLTNSARGENKVLRYINFGGLTWLLFLMKSEQYTYNLFGHIELAALIVYGALAYWKKSEPEKFPNYINLFLASGFFAVIFICDGYEKIKCIVWALETIILAYFAYRYKLKMLATWTVIIWASTLFSIIPVDGVFAIKSIKNFTPIWNIRLMMFTPLILSSAVSHYLLSKTDDKTFTNLAETFKFACITSIYLYMGLELNNIITLRIIGENTSIYFINHMTNAILGFAYAVSLKRLHNTISDFKPFVLVISALVGIFTFFYLIATGTHYSPINAFIPLINIRTVAFLFGVSACIIYNKLDGKDFYKYLAIVLGFILMHYETSDIIYKYTLNTGLISVGWILYSGIITTIGIVTGKNWLKNSGIILCIISILRIFLHDLAQVDILYKFIAILTLGISLMILSYLYNQKSTK